MNFYSIDDLGNKNNFFSDLEHFKIEEDPLLFDLRKVSPPTKKLTVKQRKAKRRAEMLIGKNKGRWSLHQKREYYVFLKIYSQFFISKELRRNDKVFKMMADFIKSRTPDQCRTHHQKLQSRYFRISKILQALKYDFGEVKNQEIMQKCGLMLGPTAPEENYSYDVKFQQQNDDNDWNRYLVDEDIQQKNDGVDYCKIEELNVVFNENYLWDQESG